MSRRIVAAAIGAAAGLALLAPGAEAASKPLVLGTAEPGYTSGDAARRDRLYDETVAAGAGVVRISAFWFRIAQIPPLLDGANPRDLSYDFDSLDAAVRDARAHGLDVILTLQRAPAWAEGPGKPGGLGQGVWDPDPEAFGDFAQAVATRYSGDFAPNPLQPQIMLPRVPYYQAWNEPNLRNHLMPQYDGNTPVSVEIYRDLLNEAFAGVEAADPEATVVAAGTAPLESDRANDHVGPQTFWRKLLCLSPSLQSSPCPGGGEARFDVFDHHPITRRDPAVPGPGDSVLISDFGDLTEILRAAESQGTIDPGSSPRRVWATEIYWETNPPEPHLGLAPVKAANYLQRGIRMLYERGVSLQLNFFLADPTESPELDFRPGGLLYNDLSRKPSFTAFRFPFVTERASRRKIVAWGKAPAGGRLRIQRKVRRRWKSVKTVRVESGAVFRKRLKLKGKASLRAKLGSDKSLVYRQR